MRDRGRKREGVTETERGRERQRQKEGGRDRDRKRGTDTRTDRPRESLILSMILLYKKKGLDTDNPLILTIIMHVSIIFYSVHYIKPNLYI